MIDLIFFLSLLIYFVFGGDNASQYKLYVTQGRLWGSTGISMQIHAVHNLYGPKIQKMPFNCSIPNTSGCHVVSRYAFSLSHTYITPNIYTIEVLCHCSQYFNCAYRNVIFNFTCVWQKLFLLAYFTIQFIFATIYRSHGTISANFYFYLLYFQLKVFSFNKIIGSQTDPKHSKIIIPIFHLSFIFLFNLVETDNILFVHNLIS